MRIERSNPDSIVCIDTNGTPWSRKDYLAAHKDQYHRNDIYMLLVENGDKITQLWVYPTKSGEPRGEAIPFLCDEELQWCRDENRRLLVVAQSYPQFNQLLKY